ncbi:diacylglycerol kinase, putative [Theileria equi strain WA]|uniref:diacylglycerol kinase (ATP) n=1 Tax=Theileria equi strain WA TaxID=1537102 RepID=L0AWF8_THEEQ|nr:diacylglycerol kinase, putative [Theileria equi strain WA]AFZ79366.1 diacylglycerol kinase, putative [Theileria equi strain WA]|eukprot:XP_004829032.1 diacylglycerol kinase, putative [Theileria equi strain WA]
MEFIYIFVNPESGGKSAYNFIEPCVDELKFSKPVPHIIRIYSIFEGESGNKPGFIHLKKLVSEKRADDGIKVIIAGGDGSLTWVISEVEKHGISTEDIVFGIVPYGTGNDFARAVKWNKFHNLKPFVDNLRPLRGLVEKILNAECAAHDFWHILITVEPEGSFNQINSNTRTKQTVFDINGDEVKKMEFMMGNYFSIGTESRIGRGFDRRRSFSTGMNKFRYLMEGIKRSVLGQVFVDKQIDKMLTGELYNDIVFVTEKNDENVPVLPKTVSFIATNIPSFAAGVDCFKGKHLGLSNLSKGESSKLFQASQRMGDGQLEFTCYKAVSHMALDLLASGHSRRVHVGKGPWKIVFKQLSPAEKTYFQIDGEFFVMFQPKEVEIKHVKTIRVLV